MAKQDRGKLDDTLAAMFSNILYRDTYLFYAHMVGQCSIKIRRDIPSCAGVAFSIDHFNMYINPDSRWKPLAEISIERWVNTMEDDLRKNPETGIDEFRIMRGFDDYTLVERLAILKHEMLHILYGHVKGDRSLSMPGWRGNIAMDCALNQHIDAIHLPSCAVMPESLSKMYLTKFPLNRSTEEYYNLIPKGKNKNGEGGEGGDPSDQLSNESMDTHDTWEESNGDSELQEDMTKKMIERSQNETIKSKGTVPSDCSDWIKMFSRKSEVNWKKVLRGIVGNKKVGSRPTIMRPDRRFPNRSELRGKTKDRMFNLLVIADVSGSMSNQAIITTLAEVQHICDVTKTDVDLIQVDTQAYKPEKLKKTTSAITRKGCGGTQLFPAIEMADKHGIDYQAVVVLTDGGLFGDDVEQFRCLKKKIIWLVESTGHILDEMKTGQMRAFKLKAAE